MATEKKEKAYKVESPFTLDRLYNRGETVILTNEKTIQKLLIQKIIK